MKRSLLLVGLCVVSFGVSTTASAQFQGLDLGKKGSKSKSKTKSKGKDTKKDDKKDDSAAVPLPEGGLDLNKPAEKADAPPPKKEAPTKSAPMMSLEGVELTGKTGDRQRLDAAAALFKQEQYEQAALASSELMNDPKMAALHLEANYLLAKSLYRMGLYHSSLGEFSRVLAKGPSSKFFKSSLEWLFFISRKTVNETVVLDEIAKYANADFPDRFKSEFRYLLARYNFVRGKALDDAEQKGEADKSFEELRRLVLMIPNGDPFFPKAKYLEGLALFRDNKLEASLNAMKEVVRATRLPPEQAATAEGKLMQSLRELAFMQLGRTHYGARQNRNALHYFGKVERGGVQWLESLFESAWANYRIGQYEQALGNLITLSSPFFRDEYFPEALILKAVIYFENCRYRESLIVLEDFERIYGPVQEQLSALIEKNMPAADYYGVLAEVQRKNKSNVEPTSTDIILERILGLALTDKDLKKTVDSIAELEGEIDQLGTKADAFKFSDLSKVLIEGLKLQREQLVSKAGLMSKSKLEFEMGALKKLRADGLRIKFETTNKEKEFLEAQLQQGGQTETVRKYKYSVAVSDDHLYWPYTGEYWRDELGTYQYTLTKGCLDRESANTSKSDKP